MRPSPISALWPGLLLTLAAGIPAFAHHLPPGMEEVDEFADHASFLMGFNHPLGGMVHLASALLIGAVAARLGRGGRMTLPGAAAALAAGCAAGAAGITVPGGEAVIVASVVAGVAAVFLKAGRVLPAVAAVLVVFQFWHGNVHAVESPARAAGGLYAAGAVVATLLLMIMGFAITRGLSRRMPDRLTEARAI
jgi:urease accessory protein